VKISLRGDDDGVRRAIVAAGGEFVGPTEADLIVAAGERSLVDAALAAPSVPILAVDAGAGRYSTRPEGLAAALDAFSAGTRPTAEHPIVTIRVNGESVARAAVDVLLVTAEPARISEYAVRTGDDPLAEFRADGVVVAPPLGSEGYAKAAGGPVLAPGTGLAVVPVSPFSTSVDTWVVADEVALTVERDDGDVSLFADGREVRPVAPHEPVRVEVTETVELLRPPASARE
jgi:NAD+ kinase